MHKIQSILVVFMLCFVSKTMNAQEKIIEINLEKASIEELVQHIEKQSQYYFYYEKSVFDSLKVTINTKSSLSKILDEVLGNTNFRYTIYGYSVFLLQNKQILTVLPSQFSGDTVVINRDESAKLAADISAKKVSIAATEDNKLYTIGIRSASAKATATIAGTVKFADTGEPAPGVSVYITNPQIGTKTNEFGFYSLSLPRGQRYELNIRSVGLKDTRRQILLQNDGKLDINVYEEPLSLKEVVITTEKASNIRHTQMGIEKLDIKTIKQVPTVFGEADILRVVLTLPGVKSVGESSTGFNVRGGSVDQNLILFNDATIYNPSHFFGFFSAFNPDLVKDVHLYKSSIPAKYGGRLSSVLELNSREGNKKEFTGTAGIGLITSRLNVEGPLIKDKTSFIFGGRTTYSNWIMDMLPKNAGYHGAKASFYDLNLIVNHQHNQKNDFFATAYFSNDKSNLSTDTTFQYSNQNISLKWKHIFNNKLYGTLSGGYDKFSYNNYSNYKEEVDYKLKFNISQANLKANFNYYLNTRTHLDFGLSSILYKNSPGSVEPYNDKSLVIADILQKEQALESAAFLEQRYDLTDAITINTGLRYSLYNYLGPARVNIYADDFDKSDENIVSTKDYSKGENIKTYHGPEFRLGVRFLLSEDFSVKAGFNTQRQFIHMLSNTTSISPTDIWKLSDKNIAPQNGRQISLGFYKNFKSNTIETSVEGYYKNIKDFLDYKSGAVLILNHSIEQDVLPTQGKAYGVEFLVKKLTGKMNGWLSYTYSKTLLKTEDVSGSNSINEGKYYPANYDKPHDFTLIGNYKFSHRISFSLNLTYSTGRPITLPVGKYNYAGGQRLLYSDRNQYRIANYFRSDISFNILGNHKKKQLTHNSWTFGIYNVTGRKNVFSTFFASENKLIKGYQLSVFGAAIPFVNYNIRFR